MNNHNLFTNILGNVYQTERRIGSWIVGVKVVIARKMGLLTLFSSSGAASLSGYLCED